MLVYLLHAKPYASRLMAATELGLHSLELAIFACAAALQSAPLRGAELHVAMVACFFSAVGVLLLHEAARMAMLVAGILRARCERRARAAPLAA
jgi:hypothetical protein